MSSVARRVRPSDRRWPSASQWESLDRQVDGQLSKVMSPFTACDPSPDAAACAKLFENLKNPYYIGDQAGLTQSLGWAEAWTSVPSVYAVTAKKTEHVVAAVNFGREHDLRLVVEGGGHSYQGTSCAPDSLLIWMREMDRVVLHDEFVASGCAGQQPSQPVVTIGAGAIWMHVYNAVTTKAGRYVQGGGCATVGVAGLRFKAAASEALQRNTGWRRPRSCEAEIVTREQAQCESECLHQPRPVLGNQRRRWRQLGRRYRTSRCARTNFPNSLAAYSSRSKPRLKSPFVG